MGRSYIVVLRTFAPTVTASRMSVRKGHRELQAGFERLENMWDSMVEKHLSIPTSRRSYVSLALGGLPHVAILFFTVLVVWTAQPSSSLFSWHPTLMSIAFGLLMSEAVLLFSVWSSPVQESSRSYKVQWHWVLQSCTLLCAYTGLAVITTNKVQAGKQHYTSWHGVVGISVCGGIAMQAAGGIAVMWPSVLPFKLRLVTLKRLHAVCGTVNYCGALLTLLLGLYSTWFMASAANSLVWMACLCSLGLLAAALPLQVIYNHFLRCGAC